MEIPPYLRIAGELRQRIVDGELAPGERVPSTRRIAQEWGVALATATKVLATLRQEGLVVAEARVGTVVAPLRSRSRRRVGSDGELSRERVVRAAIEIADAEGLAALSMRGVAERLGVATMSPYRHVGGKGELITLMADAAYGELGYPDEAPRGWRARVELGARTLWALHKRHPWLAQLTPVTRPLPLPNLLVHGEWLLSALDGLGLGPAATMNLQILVYSHLQGIAVNLERETHAQAATGLSDEEWVDANWPPSAGIGASGWFPTFTRVVGGLVDGGGFDLDLDELFELGLGALLNGITLMAEH
ncbi:GntR family transcriptional regulator [Actinokineospora sp. G85]|uniref:GntR family transcriptional regulator n=1 Tax=Actinokineospora sp. G85 TaxID=3406626 RepID=UPI003C71EA5F